MSADGYSACPNCLAQHLGRDINEITVADLNNTPLDEEAVRECFHPYLDQGHVVFEYYGGCRECDWETSNLTRKIPWDE